MEVAGDVEDFAVVVDDYCGRNLPDWSNISVDSSLAGCEEFGWHFIGHPCLELV